MKLEDRRTDVHLLLPLGLLHKLDRFLKRAGLSRNAYLRGLIMEALAKQGKPKKKDAKGKKR